MNKSPSRTRLERNIEMPLDKIRDTHEFVVTDVQLAEGDVADGIALVLKDARGGRVRLHLNRDMADLLARKLHSR